jgi:hypothetical protein
LEYDRLSFVKTKRQSGSGKTERGFYDFAANDCPFTDVLEPGDFITPFGWLPEQVQRSYFAQLLLRTRSELRSGRVPLYLCAECGDPGCGCLSVVVSKYDDCFVWSEFGFESDHEDSLVESYESIRTYAFQKSEYYAALNRFGFE